MPDTAPTPVLPRGSRTGLFFLDGGDPCWVVTLDLPGRPTRAWRRRSLQAADLCRAEIEQGRTPPGEARGLIRADEAQA